MVLHQVQIPVLHYPDNPNYSFSYDVNDEHTGDIKSQHESRRGDTVTGQYSLIQPDGIRRTVDYKADDYQGFLATVSNDGRPIRTQDSDVTSRTEGQSVQRQWPTQSHERPTQNREWMAHNPTQNVPSSAPAVATSRVSVVRHLVSNRHNPWN